MSESAAVEAATSERDVLLATKLSVPGLRPDLVPRPRLAQRLDEGRDSDLSWPAPAGYGGLSCWPVGRTRPASGAPLPDAVAAALAARTEGWAAGLQLAGLSLRGQTDVDGFVAAFTGSHRYVLDYLAEEVLEQQSEQVRTFLLETSVLERLSGELCDAVTGRPGSQALLEQVERAGLFLVPLDEVRGWWRYHHLFADLLRARLQTGTARQGFADCTATRPPGTRSAGWPMTRSGTRWPPGR